MLTNRYKTKIDSGFLNVLMAPAYFYPNKPDHELHDYVFKDKPDRIKWRIKQNYDVSYLMAYSKDKGIYYLQVFVY